MCKSKTKILNELLDDVGKEIDNEGWNSVTPAKNFTQKKILEKLYNRIGDAFVSQDRYGDICIFHGSTSLKYEKSGIIPEDYIPVKYDGHNLPKSIKKCMVWVSYTGLFKDPNGSCHVDEKIWVKVFNNI